MYYVGLDVHSSSSSLEILDDDGKTFKRLEVKGPWEAMLKQVESLPTPRSVCYEASCGYGHLHEAPQQTCPARRGGPSQAAPPDLPQQTQEQPRGRRQAREAALPGHGPPGPRAERRRACLAGDDRVPRQKLLARRTAVKNQLRAILRGHGVKAPRNLWYGPGLAWLKGVTGLEDFALLQRDMLLEELGELDGKVKRVERELAKTAARHPAVTLLMTIPGVGIRTAEAFVAYVDDVTRFARTSQLGVYFGLVPCQDAPADKNRLGHITRDGPSTVRKVLCESSWQAVRRSPTVKAWFDRIAGGDEGRRKIAIVAVARKLAVVMGAMMRSGETWREGYVRPPRQNN